MLTDLNKRNQKGLVESQEKIVRIIAKNPSATIKEMSETIGISLTAIDKNISTLKRKGILERVGSDTRGTWGLKFLDEK